MIVYRHRRLDNNKIFYVGIGKSKQRAYNKYHRSGFWKRIVNKTDYSVEIIAEVDTWEEACELEQLLIQEYGRINTNTGILCNLTDGGEGVLGHIHSNETITKISNSKKGCISPNKGSKYSEERALKCSSLFRNDKLILDTENGIYYNSIKEASEVTGIKRTTLNAMLRGQNPNKTKLKYV